MGIVQKDALRTTVISYIGILLGYINKGFLFLIFLSQEQIGLISLIITVGTLFAQIAGFGTAFTTLRFFPFFKNNETKNHGFLSLMLSYVFVGIVFTTLLFLVFKPNITHWYSQNSKEFVTYYWWVFPIGIGYVLYLLLEAYLRSLYKNILSVFTYDILLRLGVTVSLILYAKHWMSFDIFLKFNSLIYLLPVTILIFYLISINEFFVLPKHINISKRFKKIIIGFTAFNYFNALGYTLVLSLDVMMIAQMIGLDATGVYATIVFLASALLVPNRSIVRISAPLVSEFWKKRDMKHMNELYVKSGSISLFIGLASFVFLWLNIDLIFSFLKPEFQPGIGVFFALMMGRFFDMFFGLTGMIFVTSKKYKYDIYFTLSLVILVFSLNLLFIPIWGIVGAAISTSIALAVYNLGRYLFIYFAYGLNPFEKNQFIVIGLAVLTVLIGEYVGSFTPNLWWGLAIKTGVYLLAFMLPIYLFKLENQSIQFVKNVMYKIRGKR